MKKPFCSALAAGMACGMLFTLSGCSDDEKNHFPLSIPELSDGVLTLYYPTPDSPNLEIDGGKAPYEVSCSAAFLKVGINTDAPNCFRYEATDIGKATVTVTDARGETLDVPVEVVYGGRDFDVYDLHVMVSGDGLTAAESEEIKEKALSMIPVGPNALYSLKWTAINSGILFVHKSKIDAYRYEGTFTEIEGGLNSYTVRGYEMQWGDEAHTFYLCKFGPGDARVEQGRRALIEDLTEKFRAEYPAVERVYTMQFIK